MKDGPQKRENVSPIQNGGQQPQKIQGVIVPAPLWVQIMDHIRDTPCPPKQAIAILEPAQRLVPQEITLQQDGLLDD